MSDKITYITVQGLTKLRAELDYLKTAKRKEIAGRIQEAKELGDLSENAEYTEAKEEQGFVEGRILELEDMTKNVEVIQNGMTKSRIVIGSMIRAKNPEGKLLNYRIVGSRESDPNQGLISNESPIGKAFLGKQKGDVVEVKTPRGALMFQILEIG